MVIDAASGAVHSVDEVAYDAIQKLDAEILRRGAGEVLGDEGLVSRISSEIAEKHGISAEDADETLEDIAELYGQRLLWSEDPFEQAADEIKIKQSVLKAICLHVAHGCNMDCEYCFAGKGDYSGIKEKLFELVGEIQDKLDEAKDGATRSSTLRSQQTEC